MSIEEFAAKCEEALAMILDGECLGVTICHAGGEIMITIFGGTAGVIDAGTVEFTVKDPSFQVDVEGYKAEISCFKGHSKISQATIFIENPEYIEIWGFVERKIMWGAKL